MSSDDTTSDVPSATEPELTPGPGNSLTGSAAARLGLDEVTGTPANEPQRQRTDGVIRFAGTDPRSVDDVELPSWWRSRIKGDRPEHSLREVARYLPRSAKTEVRWLNPETGEWHKTEKHIGLYNPMVAAQARFGTYEEARSSLSEFYTECQNRDEMDLAEFEETIEVMVGRNFADAVIEIANDSDSGNEFGQRAASTIPVGDDALWNIPSGEYTPVNPTQILDPLCDVVEDSDNNLDGVVFGEFELSRNGGRVQGDIYFDARSINFDAEEFEHFSNTPVMIGAEIGWDYFSQTSVYVKGMAMDTGCTNSMREIGPSKKIKHRGKASERLDFWEEFLETLDLLTSELTSLIKAASEEAIDFRELPMTIEDFFEHVGLPRGRGSAGYLAGHAARDVRANAEEPSVPTLWDMYSGGTYAITHHSDGNADTIEEQHRMVNDFLFNPLQIVESVQESYEEEQQRRELAEQTRIGTGTDAGPDSGLGIGRDERGAKQLESLRAKYKGRSEEFEDNEERIKNLQADLMAEGEAN